MAYIPDSGSVAGYIQSSNGSVISVPQGSVAVAIVSGSIVASFTPPANQSVSGTVGASIIGLTPFVIGGSTNASVITVGGAGPANQSVSGTVGASVIGTVPVTFVNSSISGTVIANQGTTPWVISSIYGNVSGSMAGTYTEPAVQVSVTGQAIVFKNDVNASTMAAVSVKNPLPVSVQGTVGASIIGLTPVSVSGPMPTQSVSGTVGASIVGQLPAGTAMIGSVTAYQGAIPWVIGSVYGNISGSVVATVTNNVTVVSSIAGGIFPVSGSVAAVVTNNVTVVSSIAGGIFPISGSVAAVITNSPTVVVNNGSVVAFQGTSPWAISSVYGNVSGSIAGTYTSSTVATTVTGLAMMFKPNVSSSIMTEISPTWPLPIAGAVAASISGTVTINPPSVYGNISGSVVAFQGGVPWAHTNVGSVITTSQGSIAVVIISGSVATATTNSSVMLLNGANTIGSVTALQGTNPWVQTFSNSSIIAINAGSVVTLSSGSVITVLQSSSILSVPVGSTIAVLQNSSLFAAQQGAWRTSVISSIPTSLQTAVYAQRNDLVASALGADLTWRPIITDSAGRTVIKPFVADDSATFYYQGSVVSGSVTLIQASAIGKRSYVTDFFVANTGAATTLVTFKDGSTSIIGNTIAPAGGGSNVPGMAIPFRTNPSQDLTYNTVTATSVLYLTVQGYQAP